MTDRNLSEKLVELKDRIESTDAQLIGTKGLNRWSFTLEAPSEIRDFYDLGNFKSARYLAEDLVGWAEEWVVDERQVLPLAREIRDDLHDLEDEAEDLEADSL